MKRNALFSPLSSKATKIMLLGAGELGREVIEEGVTVLIFGKNEAHVNRRMGIVLATDPDVQKAKEKAEIAAHKIEVSTRQNPKWLKQDSREKHIFQKNSD